MNINRNFGSLREHITVPNISAACFLLLTLATAGRYGFFGDELYYFACSKHLDFGYVDHPPLVALLTFAATKIFGESIFGLRLLSGTAGAITVLLSAKIAGMLGGGRLSKSLAALSICFTIAFPAVSSFFSMNPVDIMLCTLFIYQFSKTINSPSPQKWIMIGALFGVGLLNKYTFLVLGFSVLLSLIITRRWDVLKSFWMYVAGAVGFAMFLPHIMWQINHGWPTLEFMHNATVYKNLSLSPFDFLLQLTIGLNPVMFPIWLSGLVYLLVRKEAKEYRYLGWTVAIFLLVYLVQNSKIYYVFPIFPLLLSSGAVAIERFSQNYRVSWPKWVIGSAMIISGTVLMPLAVPILPVPQFVSYAKSLGFWNLIKMEKGEADVMPLHFVYRLGWKELVDSVATAYSALPQNKKKECAILASWYGIAGAIDHFGPEHGLPNAICPRNNYWIW
ncbi:MAG: glycosyltransferase family 39 protein, partial [Bacteroidota bacterium]